jgi:hypothetical protein
MNADLIHRMCLLNEQTLRKQNLHQQQLEKSLKNLNIKNQKKSKLIEIT